MDTEPGEIVHFLAHHSYFQLMLFCIPYQYGDDENKKFRKGVARSVILQDYIFDQQLRILLFTYITHIETSFKNVFCQFACQKFGNIWWTRQQYFKKSSSNIHQLFSSLFPKLQKKVYLSAFQKIITPHLKDIRKGKSKNEHIKRYGKDYDEPLSPPFSTMIEVFSFGEISKIFGDVSDMELKNAIGAYYGLTGGALQSITKTLVDARNTCAHHTKLFDKKNWQIVKVPEIENVVGNKRNTTYHICYLIYYFLKQIQPDSKFQEDLKALLTRYPKVDSGFPINWEEVWEHSEK